MVAVYWRIWAVCVPYSGLDRRERVLIQVFACAARSAGLLENIGASSDKRTLLKTVLK